MFEGHRMLSPGCRSNVGPWQCWHSVLFLSHLPCP
ncbi:rCG58686 [Rattus norvegicus]|uniref:RCG58686 n=1 Tax=Rattus norvegicus TaxID=10116 RepID=A6JLC1_RAT|nr:rCG58686 [Rattus norvegicus]